MFRKTPRRPTPDWRQRKKRTAPDLGAVLNKLQRYTIERAPISLGTPVHPFQPGDSVWVKDWKREPLRPWWTGPHTAILTTPATLKVSGIIPWVHHSRVKKANSEEPTTWQSDPDPVNPLKLTLKKTLAPEISSPAPATPQKLAGLRTAEA